MAFSEKLRSMLNQGMDLSKDFFEKAGAKAKELGELGVLKLEIIQLQGQARKVAGQLGVEVYETLVDKGQKSVSSDSPAIKETIQKLDALEKEIDAREAEYLKKGGKGEDLNTPAP